MTGRLQLHDLPRELLEHIIFFLDIDPPSVANSAQEPALSDFFQKECPLKTLSLVSKSWQSLVEPLCFKYLRMSVIELQSLAALEQDNLEQRKIKQAERVQTWQLRQWVDPNTQARFNASMKSLSSDSVLLIKADGEEVALDYARLSRADEHYVSMMANHVYDQLRPVLPSRMTDETHRALRLANFLQRRSATARSMVVYSESSYEKNFDMAGHHVWQRARIWDLTKKYFNPQRLVLICPPELLAKLAHCYTNVTDLWSFHIPYQRIELHQYPLTDQAASSSPEETRRRLNYDDQATEADGFGLLHSRYWQSFEYDEGSSLNIYGTYHYFEKVLPTPSLVPRYQRTCTYSSDDQRPPSIINLSSLQVHGLGSWLREFTYTAIFPHFVHFNHIADTIGGFKALMHLRVKLAPDKESKLLSDDERVSRGNLRLQDCWQELEKCYEALMTRLLSEQSANGLTILQRFTTLDYQNPWLEEKLDSWRYELLPEWEKVSDGSWIPKVPRPSFRNWAAEEAAESSEAAEADAPDATTVQTGAENDPAAQASGSTTQ